MPFENRPPDDSDMKIASFDTVLKDSQKALQNVDEDEYLRNKRNGNLARAHEMGEQLAALALGYEKSMTWSLFDEEESGGLASQKRVLMSFALSVGVKARLENSYVSDTALNVFDEQIKRSAPDFYEDIHATGDYSFYYLAYRRGGNVAQNIGHTFAMLCGHEDNGVYRELGEVLYARFYHEVEKITDAYQFKE